MLLKRIVVAVLCGVVAFLVCIFIGGALAAMGVPLAAFVGGFLVQWATVISFIVMLGVFVLGWSYFGLARL